MYPHNQTPCLPLAWKLQSVATRGCCVHCHQLAAKEEKSVALRREAGKALGVGGEDGYREETFSKLWGHVSGGR